MDVLGDAIRRDCRSDRPALRAPALDRSIDYRRFCTSAWKTGNFLRHLGVRSGATVAIADELVPETVVSFYGAALVGAGSQFDPATEPRDDVRVLVVPESDLGRRDVGPHTNCLAYGDDPDDPTVAHFERDVWSENPTEPPASVLPDDTLLRTSTATYDHSEVLGAAQAIVETHDIGGDDVVAVEGSFGNPTTVVAGLVAPLLADAEISLGVETAGDLVVGGSASDLDVDVPLDEWFT